MIPVNPEFVLSLGIAVFLAIVFLQSGLDKIFDFSGNVAYITELFASAPVPVPVAPLLACLALFETAAGVLSASGALAIAFTGSTTLAYWGAILSASGKSVCRRSRDRALFSGRLPGDSYPGKLNPLGRPPARRSSGPTDPGPDPCPG